MIENDKEFRRDAIIEEEAQKISDDFIHAIRK